MADSFEPRFVDLVRNYTNTTGTGDLVLGSPVPGFTGFADAVQPGDRFYYSVIGQQNGGESEVGRGTMQADGSIAREPIGGSRTDFSSGTKTVALIAAAEWFSEVMGAPDRSAVAARSTANPAAQLHEKGREGTFVFDASDRSAEVTADTAQGIYVAPVSDPTGASGAWVRSFAGPVNPCWFGLVDGDDQANAGLNDAAISAMFSCLRARAYNVHWGIYQSLDPVLVPPGVYWTSGFEIGDGAVRFEGSGATYANDRGVCATLFKVLPGAPGVIVQGSNTSGVATQDASTHASGHGSFIGRFGLAGSYAGTESEDHGLLIRGRCAIEDMVIESFGGDAVHVEADGATSGGNATGFSLKRVKARFCRDGLSVSGNTCSASTIEELDAFFCRRWGINDATPISNTYVACQASGCGLNDAWSTPSLVHANGHFYGVIAGQEAWCSTNAPPPTASDNQGWYYVKDGAADESHPDWTSGETYRAGGAFCSSASSAQHVFVGCYSEQNQAKAQLTGATLVVGGMLSAWMYGGADAAPYLKVSAFGEIATNAGFSSGGSVKADGTSSRFGPQSGSVANNNLYLDNSNFTTQLNFRSWSGGSAQTDGTITSSRGNGLTLNGMVSTKVQVAKALRATWDGKRFSLVSGYPLNLSPGSTPSNPANGDLWYDSAQGRFTKCEADEVTELSLPRISATDTVLGRATAGSGYAEEIPCTAAGRALIGAADAGTQRSELGLGSAAVREAAEFLAAANSLGDVADPVAARFNLGVPKSFAFHFSGVPSDGAVIAGAIAPSTTTFSAVNSRCRALSSPAAAVTLTIRKNGAQVGQIDFAAGSSAGTVSFTDTSVQAGDQITVHNATAADTTLADIDGLLSE